MPGKMNHLSMQGRLTKNGQLRFTKGGMPVYNGTIMWAPRIQDKDSQEWRDGETSYFDVTCWGKQGELLSEVPVGALLNIEGRIEKDYWENPDGNGRRQEKTVITIESFAIPFISDKGVEFNDGNVTFFYRKRERGPKPVNNGVEDTLFEGSHEPF